MFIPSFGKRERLLKSKKCQNVFTRVIYILSDYYSQKLFSDLKKIKIPLLEFWLKRFKTG